MKRQTYESLVSWCSFNSWKLRLTEDVPGFVDCTIHTSPEFQGIFCEIETLMLMSLPPPNAPEVFIHRITAVFILSLTFNQNITIQLHSSS